jgi:hypothetical protein
MAEKTEKTGDDDAVVAPADRTDVRRSTGGFATISAVLTLLATLVAAVPAFMQIVEDEPLVYYSVSTLPVLNVASPDYDRVRSLLSENGIPEARTLIRVMNKGTGPADLVVARIETPGTIRDLALRPDSAARSAWVSVPGSLERLLGDSIARIEIRDFAAGTSNVLEASLGFTASSADSAHTSVDVVADGTSARMVPDVIEAESLTIWSVIEVPLIILVAGGVVTLLVAFFEVISAKLRSVGVMLDLVETVRQMAMITFKI